MSEGDTTGRVPRYGRLVAEPGRGGELAELMLKAAEGAAEVPGCLQYAVNRAADDPDVLWITELWRDREAIEASLEAARESGVIAEAQPLIAEMEMIELEPMGGLEPGDGGSPDAAPGFEIRGLDEFEDKAAAFGHGEIGEARFPFGELGLSQTGFSHHRMNPGKRQAFGHVHERAEEVYVVIGGSGRIALDQEVREIDRGDAIRVSPGVVRAFEAGPEGIELLAFGARFEGDGEIRPGWWPE